MLLITGICAASASIFGPDNFTNYSRTTDIPTIISQLVANGPYSYLDWPNGHISIESYPANTSKNAFVLQYVNREDGDCLQYALPSNAAHLFFQWKEYRSATFDFGTTKDIRLLCYDASHNFVDIYSGFGTDIGQNTTGVDNSTRTGICIQGNAYHNQPTGDPNVIGGANYVFTRAAEHVIEIELKLNSPGASDGIVRMWVDGVLILDKPNVKLSGDAFGQFYIEGFQFGMAATNGVAGAFAGVSKIYRTDLIISESRIGNGTGDTTAPVVSITAPAQGATVSGSSVVVSASATDNVGVAGVQFKLDGANLGTEDTTSPFSINWNTTAAANGNHTLSAVARDAAGNTKTAANISVTVSNSGPEVNVTGNSATIADGDSTPAVSDGTDFGSLNPAGQSLTKTYTIQNTGSAALTVNAVTVSGANASDFSVINQPAASVVAGGSTTFTVKFDPSALGTRSAVVSFGSNDADENPTNFSLQGRGDLIVDNADASGMSWTGSWILSSYNPASNYFGANYRHDDNAGKGLKSARFTPTLPTAGSYEVFLRWPAATNRASNVPVDVVTAGGVVAPLQVNQKINGGTWNSLGVYTFDAGTTGSVLISNTGTTDYVVADAVMFVPADVIVDNLDVANVVKTGTWVTSTSAPGFQGSNYLHDDNSGKGSKSFRFVPDLPTAGNYEVFTRWTAAANRAGNVPVDITVAGGTVVPRQVDQRVNGGAWVSLGIHAFNAGTSGSVLIRNAGTSGFVIADAVKFTKRP